MRRIDLRHYGVFAVLASMLVVTNARAEAIDRVAWLAGCWRGGDADRVIDEQWMSPRAGLMLGMARTATPTRANSYEQMRIETDGDTRMFTSKPLGKPEESFRALAGNDDAIVFENLVHPFPQRIIYRRSGPASLAARIEGLRGERLVGIDFPMQRVACA